MANNHLYKVLSKEYNKTLPWGSLTGVRPTKLARDLISYGEMKEHLVAELLSRDYFVSKEKAELATAISDATESVYNSELSSENE